MSRGLKLSERKCDRSETMRRVKSRDTGAEMIVRRLLHSQGYRYRLHRADLPGKPDVVFPGRKKVIFVHGCFWHQHHGCRRADRPSSNTDYWNAKLSRNKQRDVETLAKLTRLGWSALVLWECQLKDEEILLKTLTDFLA